MALLMVACDNPSELPPITGTTNSKYILPEYTFADGTTEGVLYSFTAEKAVLANEVEVSVQLFERNLTNFKSDKDLIIPLKVDPASTAQLDEQFTFENGKPEIMVPKGSNIGTVKLLIKGEVNDKKNHIVLIPDTALMKTLKPERYPKISINIAGPEMERIVGKWQMDKLVTNKAYMDEFWWGGATFEEPAFPVENKADQITITMDKLMTSFVSSFKNYFPAEAKILNAAPKVYNRGKIEVLELEIDGVNRTFTEGKQSEDNKALVGFKINENNNNELTVYVYDYVSDSFAPEFKDFEMYYPTKPQATDSGMYLEFTMKRVQE